MKVTDGLSQYQIQRSFTTVTINVTLPADLVCKHCVFQWKYRTGNSWGTANGKACLGCGKQNEEFYGCSDIAIASEAESAVNSTTPTIARSTTTTVKNVVVQPTTTTIRPPPPRKCTSAVVFSQSYDLTSIMEGYCQTVCPNNCAADKVDGNEILYNGCVSSCTKLCACQ